MRFAAGAGGVERFFMNGKTFLEVIYVTGWSFP
jgi:hypothetical protein